jgi:hypothetical protein
MYPEFRDWDGTHHPHVAQDCLTSQNKEAGSKDGP